MADTKTLQAHGVWAAVAVTAVTAQNTQGVQQVHLLPADVVRAQIESVAADLGVDAAKTGMLGTAEIVASVVAAVRDLRLAPLVVDPVLVSSTGSRLLAADGLATLRDDLLPLATLVTPNLAEAAALTGLTVADRPQMAAAGRGLVELGAAAALVTGGHLDGETGEPRDTGEPGGARHTGHTGGSLESGPPSTGGTSEAGSTAGGDTDEAVDCLVIAGRQDPVWLVGPRLVGARTHGTGCVLSAAACARLARGEDVEAACRGAKAFVTSAIRAALALGAGMAPVDPGFEPQARRAPRRASRRRP